MKMETLNNPGYGKIPDYWSLPLGSYNNEVCFVTADSVVAAPRLLIRTIFPDFDSLLCPGCVLAHERVTVFIKDVRSSDLESAFRSLASNDPSQLAAILQLSPLGSIGDNQSEDGEMVSVTNQKPSELLDNIKTELEELDSVEDDVEEEEKEKCEVKYYNSDLCEFESGDQSTLESHKLENQKSSLHICSQCDFVGKYYQALRNHMEKVHGVWSIISTVSLSIL